MTTTSPALSSWAEHGRHRGLLAVEHARRPDVPAALVPGELHHAALGGDVATQDGEAAGGFDRLGEGPHDALPVGLDGLGGVLADRPAVTVGASEWRMPASLQTRQHERHATRLVELGGDILPARLKVAQQRGALGDRLELVDLERHAHFMRDGQQVQYAVGRSAAGGDRCDRVLSAGLVMMSLGRWPRRRTSITSSPTCVATASLRPSSAGTIEEPAGEMPSASKAIAIVFAVNCPPQAPAPGDAASSSSCSSCSVILPAASSPTASKTCWIVTSAPCSDPA